VKLVKRREVVVNSPYRVPKEVVPLGEPPGVVCHVTILVELETMLGWANKV
jgi:hypothetical protein